jgi:hypothetical protein
MSPRPRSVAAPIDEGYWILIMGMTGSGKSTFINLLAEDKDRVRVGHSLNSTTADVQDHIYRMADGRVVHLLDTPGFDDTSRSDTDVLQTIANKLNELYELDLRVDGVIYMHPIIDPRMSGAALKSLGIFRRICGEKYFPHIALVSTKWESLKGEEARLAAKRRETDLLEKPEFWGDLFRRGSMPFRHDARIESAMNIVQSLVEISEQASLKLQVEMRHGKHLIETDAGSFVEGEILKMKENYEKEFERLKSEARQLRVEGDLQEEESVLEQTKAVQAKISGLKYDVESLRIDSRGLEGLKGSQRRRSLATWDREKALSDDERFKIEMKVQELRAEQVQWESLLKRNKEPEQEQRKYGTRVITRNGHPCLERRMPPPNEVQLSARFRRDEKRVNEIKRNAERDLKMSERSMLRSVISPCSLPQPSRVISGNSPERQASPPPMRFCRSRTLPSMSTFDQQSL